MRSDVRRDDRRGRGVRGQAVAFLGDAISTGWNGPDRLKERGGRRKAYLKAVKSSAMRMMIAISRAMVRRRRIITLGSKIDRRMSILGLSMDHRVHHSFAA
jgi:hypothetical protein